MFLTPNGSGHGPACVFSGRHAGPLYAPGNVPGSRHPNPPRTDRGGGGSERPRRQMPACAAGADTTTCWRESQRYNPSTPTEKCKKAPTGLSAVKAAGACKGSWRAPAYKPSMAGPEGKLHRRTAAPTVRTGGRGSYPRQPTTMKPSSTKSVPRWGLRTRSARRTRRWCGNSRRWRPGTRDSSSRLSIAGACWTANRRRQTGPTSSPPQELPPKVMRLALWRTGTPQGCKPGAERGRVRW
jgi:hypothetical protein